MNHKRSKKVFNDNMLNNFLDPIAKAWGIYTPNIFPHNPRKNLKSKPKTKKKKALNNYR